MHKKPPEILYVVLEFRLDLIEIKDGEQHERGKPRGKAAVIEHEAAVHGCGGGADDGADKSRKHTDLPTVFARERTKTRGEGDAVDIALCGKRPRHVHAADEAEGGNEREKDGVSHRDGPYVARMLTVSGKGECREGDAHGGTREADALRKEGEDLGQDEDHVEVREDAKSVNAHVDKAHGHAEFIQKVCAVACAMQELRVSAEAEAVEREAKEDRGGKEQDEKDVHKAAIGIGQGVIFGVYDGDDLGRIDAEGAIHKRIDENAEDADGKTCFIHIEAAVHGGRAGEKRGHDEADGDAEKEREAYAQHGGLDLTCGKLLTEGVAEDNIADEGTQRRGEKRDVDVIAVAGLGQLTVNEDADEGRPHIEKVETLEAMRHDEHITREGGGGRFYVADLNDDVTSETADGGVEKRAAETAEGKIIGDELGGGSQDAEDILPKIRFAGVDDGDRCGNEKGKADEKRIKSDDLSRVFAVVNFRVVSGDVRCV